MLCLNSSRSGFGIIHWITLLHFHGPAALHRFVSSNAICGNNSYHTYWSVQCSDGDCIGATRRQCILHSHNNSSCLEGAHFQASTRSPAITCLIITCALYTKCSAPYKLIAVSGGNFLVYYVGETLSPTVTWVHAIM